MCVSAHLKPAREYIAIGNKDTWLIFVGTIVPISFAGLKKKKICWSHCCYTVGKHIFGLQLRVKIKIHIFV